MDIQKSLELTDEEMYLWAGLKAEKQKVTTVNTIIGHIVYTALTCSALILGGMEPKSAYLIVGLGLAALHVYRTIRYEWSSTQYSKKYATLLRKAEARIEQLESDQTGSSH